jgi:alcohol dehydrogenase (cytochrome c)
MLKSRLCAAFLALAASAATAVPASEPTVSAVTDTMLRNPAPADWLMWRRTLDSWGYSPLDQVNRRNVRKLQMAWTRAIGPGLQETTPLVHDGVMYLANPGDVIQALDAASGDLLWEYRRPWQPDIPKTFPVPYTKRNIAIYDDLIIDTSADDHLFALDAHTGKVVWDTQVLDYHKNAAQQTSGPIIADGKAISGRGCEPKGGPEACVITAHDARTGKELWRTRTIPAPGEPGDETWGDVPFASRWHVGTWMVPSYDPELNLIYIGTSVTSPAPKFLLGGNDKQHLYHNSTLALDANTGKIVWYYQHVVDHWDMDHTFERILLDTVVAPNPNEVTWINPNLKPGEKRKVLTGIPGKTGIVYTLDRRTGEFLWARPTVHQNIVEKIDGATGKVTLNPAVVFNQTGQQLLICPTMSGGKNWPAGAYSPLTHMMYFPLHNTCADVTAVLDKPSLESLYGIAGKAHPDPEEHNIGTVQAISVETGAIAWKYQQRAVLYSLVATGGGLLFGGDANGRARAIDQKTGKVLWEINLGSPVTGFPITYAVKGKQYVAMSTGSALLLGQTAAFTPELRASNGNNIFVFALPN